LDSGCRVWGRGFRVWDAGCRVWDLGFRAWDSGATTGGARAQACGLEYGTQVQGQGSGVSGLGVRGELPAVLELELAVGIFEGSTLLVAVIVLHAVARRLVRQVVGDLVCKVRCEFKD
jgi:hypothetical protein